MVKYIINADDLGLNPTVNKAIDNYLSEGLISSSTIMSNTECWPEVESIVARHPDASFGVHLNLTQGPSMTKSPVLQKYGLTDTEGNFVHVDKNSIKFEPDLVVAIENEWRVQIQMVRDHHINISHFDGHHHVHTWYELESVLIRLCKEYQVFMVRNRYTVPFSCRKLVSMPVTKQTRSNNNAATTKSQSLLGRINTSLKLRLESSLWRWRLRVSDIRTTDYFHFYESIYNMLKKGGVLPSDCVVELMCHPGHEKYFLENQSIEDGSISTLSDGTLISYNHFNNKHAKSK